MYKYLRYLFPLIIPNIKGSLLTLYSEVQTKQIQWIWFPYIAYGKITLSQGGPGDGKSTMMMHLITELSTGGAMPDGTALLHGVLSPPSRSDEATVPEK